MPKAIFISASPLFWPKFQDGVFKKRTPQAN